MTCTDEMACAFPADNPLAPLLRQAIAWLEDQGCVHLGSGSLMRCVLTDTIQDLLRLLLIGYDELCWPEQCERTPQEVREDEYADDDYPPPPLLLRRYVAQTLRLSIPRRASAIVPNTVCMDTAQSDDPFWNWLKRVRGE